MTSMLLTESTGSAADSVGTTLVMMGPIAALKALTVLTGVNSEGGPPASPRLRGEGSASAERAERSEAGVRGRSRKRRPSAAAAPPSSPPPHPRLLRRLAASASRVFPACAPKNGPRVDPRSGGPLPASGERRSRASSRKDSQALGMRFVCWEIATARSRFRREHERLAVLRRPQRPRLREIEANEAGAVVISEGQPAPPRDESLRQRIVAHRRAAD